MIKIYVRDGDGKELDQGLKVFGVSCGVDDTCINYFGFWVCWVKILDKWGLGILRLDVYYGHRGGYGTLRSWCVGRQIQRMPLTGVVGFVVSSQMESSRSAIATTRRPCEHRLKGLLGASSCGNSGCGLHVD